MAFVRICFSSSRFVIAVAYPRTVFFTLSRLNFKTSSRWPSAGWELLPPGVTDAMTSSATKGLTCSPGNGPNGLIPTKVEPNLKTHEYKTNPVLYDSEATLLTVEPSPLLFGSYEH
ncbi:hypothetical protein EVAR_93676_1 [Eumeta japonica]|uniref:Uncharacterized protein n=1 Tax=Eumeta variegata TaxID=151549 RepID=A0A4C1TQS3_EUMVA|nr:hypothetical protein EVAR_93676_1 [Eumeta japonica]